jgi:hypothetical protein
VGEMRDGSDKISGEKIGKEVKLGFLHKREEEADIFGVRIGEKTCFIFIHVFLFLLFSPFSFPFIYSTFSLFPLYSFLGLDKQVLS